MNLYYREPACTRGTVTQERPLKVSSIAPCSQPALRHFFKIIVQGRRGSLLVHRHRLVHLDSKGRQSLAFVHSPYSPVQNVAPLITSGIARRIMKTTTEKPQDEGGCPTPTCSLSICEMARRGMKLPKGTRIRTTQGGIPTGGAHEINVDDANKISQAFTDPRPFWCYGWDDLHDSLILPANA